MEKFGIFKLITSLLEFYNREKSASSQEKTTDKPSSYKANVNETPTLNDSLTSPSFPLLFGQDNAKNEGTTKPLSTRDNAEKKLEEKNGVSPNFLPLQKEMLSVIKSHDEFIKRVKNSTKIH